MHGLEPEAGEVCQRVGQVLNEERFAPAEGYAALLIEGEYLCSVRTMYRIVAEQYAVRERRDQLSHPTYAAPELIATRPAARGFREQSTALCPWAAKAPCVA